MKIVIFLCICLCIYPALASESFVHFTGQNKMLVIIFNNGAGKEMSVPVEMIGIFSLNEVEAIGKELESLRMINETSENWSEYPDLERFKIVLLKGYSNYFLYKEEWIEEDKKRKASRIAVFSQGEIIKYLI